MKLYWPTDFYVGVSSDRKRMLEVPTVCCFDVGSEVSHCAGRFEATLIVSVCIIIDFIRLR